MRSRAPSAVISLLALALAVLPGVAGPDGTVPRAAGLLLLAFWGAAAVRFGAAVARAWDPEGGAADPRVAPRIVRTLLWTVAFVVLVIACAGAAGQINRVFVTVVSGCVFVLLGPRTGRADLRPSLRDLLRLAGKHPAAATLAALLLAITVTNMACGMLSPVMRYDDLNYHLVFPVEWSQSGTLSTRQIPFGNHSPAYYPKNMEMVYTWAFLPVESVSHIVAVQAFVLGFLVLALFDLFRRSGATARSGFLCALLALVSPVVVREMSGSYVDVAFALFFVLVLRGVAAFARKPGLGAWIELSVAAGLFAGTKILGIVLLGVVLAPGALVLLAAADRTGWPRPDPKALAAGGVLGGGAFLAAGGWWYLHNLLVTGNPVFPMMVELGGIRLFDGAYDRGALPASELVTVLHLFSPALGTLLAAGAVVTIGRALAVRRRGGTGHAPRRSGREGLRQLVVLVVPAALVLIFWLIVPFNYARFIVAAYALSCGMLLEPLDLPGRTARAVELLIVVALAADLFWSMGRGGLLAWAGEALLRPTPSVLAGGVLCAAALVAALTVASVRLTPGVVRTTALVGVAVLFLGALLVAERISDPASGHVSERVRRYWEPYLFVRGRGAEERIAATGSSETLGLYGRSFRNRVRYVNVNGTGDALFHDHVRRGIAEREMLRGDRSGVHYYRSGASYEAWIGNLDRFGADLLAVSRLTSWNLRNDYARDSEGFPIESTWAETHPERFRRIHASERMRIYEVLPAERADAS